MRRRILGVAFAAAAVVAGHFLAAEYRDARPDAEAARLAEILNVRSDATVAEIGAGKGRMTVRMARRAGRVLSNELDGEKLEDIRRAAGDAGLNNVTVVQGAESDANLPPECCEAIYLSKVYHHFTRATEMNASLYRALKPGGRLAVIDFPPRWWLGGHGVRQERVVEELTRAGFQIEREIGDWWVWPQRRFCVAARKPAGN